MRSPNWLKEEVMLAMDLYVHRDRSWINKMSDSTFEIVGLSDLLNKLDFHLVKPTNFRSTGSIRMKIANFMALDEQYHNKSLGNVGGIDRAVWKEYGDDYPLLHEHCKTIISQHLEMTDKTIEKYIDLMQLNNTFNSIEVEFGKFVAGVRKEISLFEELANRNPQVAYNIRVISSCKKVKDALSWVNELDEDDYIEHPGVNQKPIKKRKASKATTNTNEEKIGKLVRRTFEGLLDNDKLTDDMVNLLLSYRYSHDVFGLNQSFLVVINSNQSVHDQIIDENGYVRYWINPVMIHEKRYCICKEWYENQRKKYLCWLSSVNSYPLNMISANDLKIVLEYIKDIDSKKTFIAKKDIINKFSMDRIEDVLDVLMEIGVLSSFQGSTREYVVDDYDVLFGMIKRPSDYTGEL